MRAVKLTLCLAFLLVAACTSGTAPAPAPAPAPKPAAAAVLGENGLSAADRRLFYHLPEGSELFPFAWVQVVESVKTGKPFLENLERFGLIPDEKGDSNPYALPVGITVAKRKGVGVDMIGVNCASCHVGQIESGGKALRVDGAPNMFDIVGFYSEISDSMEATVKSPEKLFAFLKRYRQQHGGTSVTPIAQLGIKEATAVAADLRAETHKVLDAFEGHVTLEGSGPFEDALADHIEAALEQEVAEFETDPAAYVAGLAAPPKIADETVKDVTEEAHGASSPLAALADGAPEEALVRTVLEDVTRSAGLALSYVKMLRDLERSANIGTTAGFGRADAFGTARVLLLGMANFRPLTAPSSFPHIWNFEHTGWLHWVANTNSVLERNIGQSLGLGASVDTKTWDSTIVFPNLVQLEQLGYKITPPVWPEEVLGKIDRAKAERGAALYERTCAACHERFDTTPAGVSPRLNTYQLFAVAKVGTDPNEADNWMQPVTLDGKQMGMGEAHQLLLGKIRQAYFAANNVAPDEQLRMNSGRPETVWRDTVAVEPGGAVYPAKPLAGIWATPPYLHNGSVPTLYDLLLPADKRPKTFPVGQREYDPAKLGYKQEGAPSWAFTLDTSADGNRNTGHQYGTDLSEEERLEILEYLKTLSKVPEGTPAGGAK